MLFASVDLISMRPCHSRHELTTHPRYPSRSSTSPSDRRLHFGRWKRDSIDRSWPWLELVRPGDFALWHEDTHLAVNELQVTGALRVAVTSAVLGSGLV